MRRWFFFFTFISHINFCRTINQIGMKTRHSCCWHFVVSITPRRSIKIFIFGKVVGRRWLKIFHNWKLETGFWHVETKMIIVLFVWKLVFLSLAFFRSLLFHLLFVYLSYHLPRGSNRSSKWFLIWISARHERLCSRCSSRTPGSMHFCCRWFDFGPTHTHTHTYSREVRQESRPRDLAREPLITGHGINFNFATRPQQRSPRSGSSLIRGYYYSYIEMQPGCGRSMRTALSSILSSLLVRPSSRQGSLILFPHGYSCSPRAVFAVAIFGLRHS